MGYDKFEQRSYLKYCNGAETFYTYDNRCRLSNLAVNSVGTSIMDNAYTFDAVSNVLSVANNASLPQSGNTGGLGESTGVTGGASLGVGTVRFPVDQKVGQPKGFWETALSLTKLIP